MSTVELPLPRPKAPAFSRDPEVDRIADALFEAEAQAVAREPLRRPGATYRLQLHKGFSLEEVAAIVGYLAELGITDAYLSPYLQARPGSTHGYDVYDHGRINPEIGAAA